MTRPHRQKNSWPIRILQSALYFSTATDCTDVPAPIESRGCEVGTPFSVAVGYGEKSSARFARRAVLQAPLCPARETLRRGGPPGYHRPNGPTQSQFGLARFSDRRLPNRPRGQTSPSIGRRWPESLAACPAHRAICLG